MTTAWVECSRCGNKLSFDTPESRCPADGAPLLIRYDLEELRQYHKHDRPAALAAASPASLGMWRYADVLPQHARVTLAEGWTPLIQSRCNAATFVKDEGVNPGGSFQARGLSVAITAAKQRETARLATGSAEVAAGAFAAYCAAAGIAAQVRLPADAPFADHVQCALYGAELLPASEDSADDLSRFDAFRMEGEKTIIYEIVEQLGWVYPGALIVPASTIRIDAVTKAFDELEALGWMSGERPRLYLAGNQKSKPDAASDSHFIECDEEQVRRALESWGRNEGLLLSIEGATAAAACAALGARGELHADGQTVLVNSVSALAQIDAVAATLHLRRSRPLPASLPVGGIITPV